MAVYHPTTNRQPVDLELRVSCAEQGSDSVGIVGGPPAPRSVRAPGLLFLAVLAAGIASASAPTGTANPAHVISAVKIAPLFFNPSIGQRAEISCKVSQGGTLIVEVVDRDGFVVRKLTSLAVKPGPVTVSWDGKDDIGAVVPDEAYSPRITLSGDATDVYDSTQHFQPVPQDLTSCTYSRTEGILSYTVPWPARVHILAGQATQDPITHTSAGPVLKTVADRQPRAAGAVVESWTGLDESGTIYVPDLPHFVVALTIAPLPEGSIITVGNRTTSFFDYAIAHRPKKALAPRTHRPGPTVHYVGLSGLEERNPHLGIGVKAPFDPVARAYTVARGPLAVTLTLEPRHATYFLSRAAELNVFLDDKLLVSQAASRSTVTLSLRTDGWAAGAHRLAFNWTSGFGPLAATAAVVTIVETAKPGKHD